MDGPGLWDALRGVGVDADDPDVRDAVRTTLGSIDGVAERAGAPAARRCALAVQAAIAYHLRHPDTDDMSSFEGDIEDQSDT